jgi:hypothetical protein
MYIFTNIKLSCFQCPSVLRQTNHCFATFCSSIAGLSKKRKAIPTIPYGIPNIMASQISNCYLVKEDTIFILFYVLLKLTDLCL